MLVKNGYNDKIKTLKHCENLHNPLQPNVAFLYPLKTLENL